MNTTTTTSSAAKSGTWTTGTVRTEERYPGREGYEQRWFASVEVRCDGDLVTYATGNGTTEGAARIDAMGTAQRLIGEHDGRERWSPGFVRAAEALRALGFKRSAQKLDYAARALGPRAAWNDACAVLEALEDAAEVLRSTGGSETAGKVQVISAELAAARGLAHLAAVRLSR